MNLPTVLSNKQTERKWYSPQIGCCMNRRTSIGMCDARMSAPFRVNIGGR